uniref:Reverse transcriptase zinc-binding domain-containing protein n=1 Tax=Cuerna arida TaxID=1464854 RepID=A0A1B6EVT8_9HEMI
MIANVAAVRAIPGRSLDNNRCRHCLSEIETLAHVLGFCQVGETLRNTRHHKIRSLIAKNLKENGYEVYEEVHGLAKNGSTRIIDIICIQNSIGTILDPTIRFETDQNQPLKTNEEKIIIYEETIQFYKTKYNLKEIEIFGLLIGARGTIPKFTNNIFKKFKISKTTIEEIIRTSFKYSVYMLRNHIYNTQN